MGRADQSSSRLAGHGEQMSWKVSGTQPPPALFSLLTYPWSSRALIGPPRGPPRVRSTANARSGGNILGIDAVGSVNRPATGRRRCGRCVAAFGDALLDLPR